MAYTVDTVGDERYDLVVQEIGTGKRVRVAGAPRVRVLFESWWLEVLSQGGVRAAFLRPGLIQAEEKGRGGRRETRLCAGLGCVDGTALDFGF